MKQVKDAMSPLNAMVGPEHTLRQAAERMIENRTGASVVMDHGLPGPGSSPNATCSRRWPRVWMWTWRLWATT